MFTTTGTIVKEGNTDMIDKEGKSKQNAVGKSIIPPISATKN